MFGKVLIREIRFSIFVMKDDKPVEQNDDHL